MSLSQFRKDPLNNGWVIIATERGKRPSDFGSVQNERVGGPCVFCEGWENETPPEVMAVRRQGSEPNGPGWLVRLVTNKYAALGMDVDLNRQSLPMFSQMNGLGEHEVVVETPNHDDHICDLPLWQITEVIKLYRDRARDILKDERIRYVQIFKNWGSAAGASLEHSHSQIIALPIIPRYVREQLACANQYFSSQKRCLVCDIIRNEYLHGSRIVRENDEYLAIAPFASRFPFEIHIYPKQHGLDFLGISDKQSQLLAMILKEVLFALRVALLDPPFNYMIHCHPHLRPGSHSLPDWDLDAHWHLEIIPRLTKVAGFEWGTGFYINPTPPELATEFLREVMLPAELIPEESLGAPLRTWKD